MIIRFFHILNKYFLFLKSLIWFSSNINMMTLMSTACLVYFKTIWCDKLINFNAYALSNVQYPMSYQLYYHNNRWLCTLTFMLLHLYYWKRKKKPITCLKLMFRPEHLMFCFSGTTTSGQLNAAPVMTCIVNLVVGDI